MNLTKLGFEKPFIGALVESGVMEKHQYEYNTLVANTVSFYYINVGNGVDKMYVCVFSRDGNLAKIFGPAQNEYITKFVIWF